MPGLGAVDDVVLSEDDDPLEIGSAWDCVRRENVGPALLIGTVSFGVVADALADARLQPGCFRMDRCDAQGKERSPDGQPHHSAAGR